MPAALAWPLPDGADLRAAAALPVNYLTAWQMVRVMAPVPAGGTVLIQSAAGGVGQAVVQLCALAGVTVLGSASPAKHDALRAQGLAFVFDSRRPDYAGLVREATGGRGVEAALEPRNGRWILESYRCLSRCGHLVLFGFSGAAVGRRSGTLSALRTLAQVPWLAINPIRLMNDNRSRRRRQPGSHVGRRRADRGLDAGAAGAAGRRQAGPAHRQRVPVPRRRPARTSVWRAARASARSCSNPAVERRSVKGCGS